MANKHPHQDPDQMAPTAKHDTQHDTQHDSDDDDVSAAAGGVAETLKKVVAAGISAAFMTEESVRTFVSEMKLPKESLNLILQGASKSKEELMNRVGREIIGIISKIDFVKEASRFVEDHKFRVTAEVDVVRKDHSRESGSGGEKL